MPQITAERRIMALRLLPFLLPTTYAGGGGRVPDRHAAYNWIIDNQLARRNVTPQMAAYLRGKRYLVEKQPHGGDRKSSAQNAHLTTAEYVAEQCGVNQATIRRDAEFAEAVDQAPPETRKAILSGKTQATKPRRDLLLR